MKRISKIDLLAGLFVILIGMLAIQEAMRFNIGTARSMGPGYFPLHVGILLLLLGVGIIFVEGLQRASAPVNPDEPKVLHPTIRSLIFIPAAIFSFALLIERAGLVPAVAAAVFLSALADKDMKTVQIVVLTITIPIICVLIFGWALGLQLPAFRWYY